MGPSKLCKEGIDYLQNHNLKEKMSKGTHIIWGTGGSMVPEEMMTQYYQTGLKLSLENK